ncbi:DUF2267 domain-containing protein [Streptomyces chiangmaiensis]
MSVTHPPDFERTIHTANIWLKSVCEGLGTEDRHLAHRVLRTWMHTLRDRLTVDVAAHFAAQLPELMRGAYYDGWDPSIVPIKYDRAGYLSRFSHEARVSTEEVPGSRPRSPRSYASMSRPGHWSRRWNRSRTTSGTSSFSRPDGRWAGAGQTAAPSPGRRPPDGR